jgi:hypothetical protein
VEITGNGDTIPYDFELVDDPHQASLYVPLLFLQTRRVDVSNFPLIVTLTRVGKYHVIDATAEEEQCSNGRTLVAVTSKVTTPPTLVYLYTRCDLFRHR